MLIIKRCNNLCFIFGLVCQPLYIICTKPCPVTFSKTTLSLSIAPSMLIAKYALSCISGNAFNLLLVRLLHRKPWKTTFLVAACKAKWRTEEHKLSWNIKNTPEIVTLYKKPDTLTWPCNSISHWRMLLKCETQKKLATHLQDIQKNLTRKAKKTPTNKQDFIMIIYHTNSRKKQIYKNTAHTCCVVLNWQMNPYVQSYICWYLAVITTLWSTYILLYTKISCGFYLF